jgi:hypothetical protein
MNWSRQWLAGANTANGEQLMTRVLRSIWALLVWLFVILIPIQFYLAGHGAFEYHSTSASARTDAWGAHTGLGDLMLLISLIALLVALAGRLPRRTLISSGLLFAFMVIQFLLARAFGDNTSTRWIAALHPVNGLIVTGLGGMLAVRARQYLPFGPWRDADASAAVSPHTA